MLSVGLCAFAEAAEFPISQFYVHLTATEAGPRITSELPTIRELTGSVNSNAFTATYPRNVLWSCLINRSDWSSNCAPCRATLS